MGKSSFFLPYHQVRTDATCDFNGTWIPMAETTVNHNRARRESEELEEMEKLADWMDSRFRIPGTEIGFGLDSLFGLIPGVGDTATALSTAYLIGKARAFGLPRHVMARMIWNAFVDWLVGLIPLFGDIFDIAWKANRKNVALIREHLKNAGLSGSDG